jgi:hypothetical protein
MARSPREVAEQVRRMVAGEGVDFADLFAEDGLLGRTSELAAALSGA